MVRHDEISGRERGPWVAALAAAIAVAGYAAVGPIGCNTVEGFGEDLEAAGEGMQDETREEKYEDELEDDD